MPRRLPLPFPSMDNILQSVSKGKKPADRTSSQEYLSCSPPASTMHTTTPDPKIWQAKLKGARTAFIADDFLTATKLSYELLRDYHVVPYWARAQAALIVTAYDVYPGNKDLYQEAVRMVEAVRKMDQEQVEPAYKSLQLKIESEQKTGEERVHPLRMHPPQNMEQSQNEGKIAGSGLSDIVDRDFGMELRKLDRAQLDGNGDAADDLEDKDVEHDTSGQQERKKNSVDNAGKTEGEVGGLSEDTDVEPSASGQQETKRNSEDTVGKTEGEAGGIPEDQDVEPSASGQRETKKDSEDTVGKTSGESASNPEDKDVESGVGGRRETKNNKEYTGKSDDDAIEPVGNAEPETKKNSEDTEGELWGEATKKTKSTRECCCTVV